MLTRREFIAGVAKVFAVGAAAASGALAIMPKAAEPKIFHGKQARMWVNDVEITEGIKPLTITDEIRMLQMLRGGERDGIQFNRR